MTQYTDTQENKTEKTIRETEDARQGETKRGMRTVLIVSTMAAFVFMLVMLGARIG